MSMRFTWRDQLCLESVTQLQPLPRSVSGETCCNRPVRSVVRAEDQHRICLGCYAHDFRGRFYTRKEWDAWLNSPDEDLAPAGASERGE